MDNQRLESVMGIGDDTDRVIAGVTLLTHAAITFSKADKKKFNDELSDLLRRMDLLGDEKTKQAIMQLKSKALDELVDWLTTECGLSLDTVSDLNIKCPTLSSILDH